MTNITDIIKDCDASGRDDISVVEVSMEPVEVDRFEGRRLHFHHDGTQTTVSLDANEGISRPMFCDEEMLRKAIVWARHTERHSPRPSHQYQYGPSVSMHEVLEAVGTEHVDLFSVRRPGGTVMVYRADAEVGVQSPTRLRMFVPGADSAETLRRRFETALAWTEGRASFDDIAR